MDTPQDTIKIREIIDNAKDLIIATHENPTFDSMGSALALSLGLISIGKRVTVVCPDPIIVELSGFVGVNKVVSEFSRKNFIISLDYIEGSIEKVSYNIEGNKFNLVIEPRVGFDTFAEDKVHFSHGGTQVDAIITVDTIHLGGLKKIYDTDKDLFTSKPIINIDRHPNNAKYGSVNFIDPNVSSTAELVAHLLSVFGIKLTPDIATNLLNGLYWATNNFQNHQVSGRTFELAGACVKAGGRKFSKIIPVNDQLTAVSNVPSESGTQFEQKPVEAVERPVEAGNIPENTQQVAGKDPPSDWLKPKIFKSSTRI